MQKIQCGNIEATSLKLKTWKDLDFVFAVQLEAEPLQAARSYNLGTSSSQQAQLFDRLHHTDRHSGKPDYSQCKPGFLSASESLRQHQQPGTAPSMQPNLSSNAGTTSCSSSTKLVNSCFCAYSKLPIQRIKMEPFALGSQPGLTL